MDLANKYRPQKFINVLGQEKVIAAIQAMLERDGQLPKAMLLSGNSGIGKTTIARCCARAVETVPIEINASDKNSVEDIRELLDLASYIPLGSNKTRVIILDEAHMLSKSAWSALLKPIEEGASIWIFCTTEPNKIPAAVQSRCASANFELTAVSKSKIKVLLESVIKAEEFTIDKNIVLEILMKCDSSPRKALKQLEMVHACPTLQDARDLLKSYTDEDEIPAVVSLSRLITKGGTFQDALTIIRGIEGDWSSIRYGILTYFSKVCTVSRDIEQCTMALRVLHIFSRPWDPAERSAPLLLAVGELLIP